MSDSGYNGALFVLYDNNSMWPRLPIQICSHVNAVKGVCYSVQTSVCGNRILEPGEDCDDSSACCNQATCKLATNAKCSPGIDPHCCTSSCKFLPTTTSCDLAGGNDIG